MTAHSTLFKSDRAQVVRLPKELAFPEGVKRVAVRKQGKRRILAPADCVWDAFFDAPGVDLGEREQPAFQSRDSL
ncbi:MAG TPA: type II toxin-antitoxin system VapB family antitoxin [Sphingomonas sp.]|nr:type II toxin-antitoxin system VapB family antitoxin [Sphingomonas sp.]